MNVFLDPSIPGGGTSRLVGLARASSVSLATPRNDAHVIVSRTVSLRER